MPTLRLSALTLTALTLTACGGGDPKEAGTTALQSGDYSKAAEHFAQALKGKDARSEDFVELRVDRCRALAGFDPAAAEREFTGLTVAVKEAGALKVADFTQVASALLNAKAGVQAVNVMDLGMKRFPGDEKMNALLEKVKQAAFDSGDEAAQDALRGLGYIGGD